MLQVLDELHRIGFEQLRFSRSWFTVHWRLQLYAASDVWEQDGFVGIDSPHLCLSDDDWITWKAPGHIKNGDWTMLLKGDMKPKHLAGLFVLSFPRLAEAAYGSDHAYREWFRSIRPYLNTGMVPSTWEEHIYDGDPDFFMRHALMRDGLSDKVKVVARPPHNQMATLKPR
ncbi:hypothetical protein [Deinococcus aquaedulcis]|uniref:hypothetical protein n=1 Tax=Deinococcus aquaedulcis TaxID=2840455 RepID=UPI001C83733A|nr:hypothetical protein [Deinococcus aquaedulcis]